MGRVLEIGSRLTWLLYVSDVELRGHVSVSFAISTSHPDL
jgi:hypothetical protein